MLSDKVGLIIAFLNLTAFLLLVYIILRVIADSRSRVYAVLDKIFSPVLAPWRRLLPCRRIDAAAVILVVLLRLIAFTRERNYR
ncbi:MAG: YggT family protein [Candidatus Krumholzibacteriota bacterium]|nr:YggT family protein [Candidatus Krumholzibacteriota bacterium]